MAEKENENTDKICFKLLRGTFRDKINDIDCSHGHSKAGKDINTTTIYYKICVRKHISEVFRNKEN